MKNEYLKLKDENERLRRKIDELTKEVIYNLSSWNNIEMIVKACIKYTNIILNISFKIILCLNSSLSSDDSIVILNFLLKFNILIKCYKL